MWQHLPLLCSSFILSFQGQPLILGQIKQWGLAFLMWYNLMNESRWVPWFFLPESAHFELLWLCSFISLYFFFSLLRRYLPLLISAFEVRNVFEEDFIFSFLKKLRVENSLSSSHHLSNDVLVGRGSTGLGVRRHGSHLESVTDQWEDFESTPSSPLTPQCVHL